MLAIYYGCGLRRSEGTSLVVSDIQLEKKLIFVRKGKGSKERFVPIAEKGLQDIQEYLNYGRKRFMKQSPTAKMEEAFFINLWGEPMHDFTTRLRALKEEANITKPFSLHTFRHSIATHLLQSGMDIEHIQKFLGHSSLESTQLYTNIIHEL
jgi:site-specific recombinase XerD